jgi:segregation and condensation protein A
LRVAPPPKIETRLDMSGVTLEMLLTAVANAIARQEERDGSAVAILQPRRLTIEGQISKLRRWTKQDKMGFEFKQLFSANTTRVEVSLTLLAVLELIKRREITAHQEEMFGPIFIQGVEEKSG